jgi:hypothetical protein
MAKMFQMKSVNGISDDTARAKTGKKWGEWYTILDKAGARMMDHAEIVKFGHEKCGLSLWWSQLVTLGYEKERGIPTTRHRSAPEANCSKTLAAPLALVWDAWQDQEVRARWLPDIALQVTQSAEHKLLHFDLADHSHAVVKFSEKSGKTRVAVTHARLQSDADLERWKEYWAAALVRLNGVMKG